MYKVYAFADTYVFISEFGNLEQAEIEYVNLIAHEHTTFAAIYENGVCVERHCKVS